MGVDHATIRLLPVTLLSLHKISPIKHSLNLIFSASSTGAPTSRSFRLVPSVSLPHRGLPSRPKLSPSNASPQSRPLNYPRRRLRSWVGAVHVGVFRIQVLRPLRLLGRLVGRWSLEQRLPNHVAQTQSQALGERDVRMNTQKS